MQRLPKKRFTAIKLAALLVCLISSIAFFISISVNWQSIDDMIAAYRYQPSEKIANLSNKLALSDYGKTLFYASQPELQSAEDFNKSCRQDKHHGAAVVGCYSKKRIYIYDIKDNDLAGIKEVTAAHEMLHAGYERLSRADIERLSPLLKQAYLKNKTPELEARLSHYERADSDNVVNELHSIVGTEIADIPDDLEQHYRQYFSDRSAIVRMHANYQDKINKLNSQIKQLSSEARALVDAINSATKQYEAGVIKLNSQIDNFNQRASVVGGFKNQAEFNRERQLLIAREDELKIEKDNISAQLLAYEGKRLKLAELGKVVEKIDLSLDSLKQPSTTKENKNG